VKDTPTGDSTKKWPHVVEEQTSLTTNFFSWWRFSPEKKQNRCILSIQNLVPCQFFHALNVVVSGIY